MKQICSLALINSTPRHEAELVGENIAPPILISTLEGGKWSASHPYRFKP
jgi:hypothetical protein